MEKGNSDDKTYGVTGNIAFLQASLARKRLIGCVLVLFILAGGGLFAAFNTVIHITSTDAFCLSCHEMKGNILTDNYNNSIHKTNRTGIKVACADCHIPEEFFPRMLRKADALKEVWGHVSGVIDTPEKFAAHRDEMAKKEWARMKANDSQECRNCHDVSKLTKRFMAPFHEASHKEGQTCIDCHKGIAHKLAN
ncbi:NapC/NirT family cytochrome c [Escherichia coli]|nr:NapC/NirT family cytochrome c [Escherichia coli]